MTGHRFSFIGAGMLAFIGSESVFFAALIAADIHLHIHDNSAVGGRAPRTPRFPAINTMILVLSGVTAHYAQVSYRKGRTGGLHLLLVLTVILGAAFLGGQAWEYTHLGFGLSGGLLARPSSRSPGSTACTSLCGLGVLVFLLVRASRERRRGLAAPSLGHRRDGRRRAPTTGTSSTPCGSPCSSSSTCCSDEADGARGRGRAAVAVAGRVRGAARRRAAGGAGRRRRRRTRRSRARSRRRTLRLGRRRARSCSPSPSRSDPSSRCVRRRRLGGARRCPAVGPAQAVPGQPAQLLAPVSQPLPTGVYTVNWRSVSAVDGHVENGAFAFGVGVVAGARAASSPSACCTRRRGSAPCPAAGRWLALRGAGAARRARRARAGSSFGGRLPAGGARLLRVGACPRRSPASCAHDRGRARAGGRALACCRCS